MRYNIESLGDLAKVLDSLSYNHTKQPPRIISNDGEQSNGVTHIEVTEEPFLQCKECPDIMGYPNEMKQLYTHCDPELFNVIEPVGTVFIFIGKVNYEKV